MTVSPLKVWFEADGRLLRLRLARPKANIIDAAMIAVLRAALSEHLASTNLSGVLDHCLLLVVIGPAHPAVFPIQRQDPAFGQPRLVFLR